MLIYFLFRNLVNISVLFKLFGKNRGMNKETGIRSIYCSVQIQFGKKKIEKLVITDGIKYLVKLM